MTTADRLVSILAANYSAETDYHYRVAYRLVGAGVTMAEPACEHCGVVGYGHTQDCIAGPRG